MNPDVVGISILGRAMLIESAERAFEAAWAMDGQAISMPTTPGKRTAKLRTTLTKRVIDTLQPADKPWTAWDDKLTGFGVRILPSGTKSFIVNYRPGGGRNAPNKRVVIGRYGKTTPDQARRLARIILGQAAGGADPIYERVAARVTSSPARGRDGGTSEMGAPKDTAPTTQAKYLNNREAAEYLGLSVRTMNRYRVTGDGPPYYRLGGRVRYARDELNEWVTGSRRTSTSDEGPG